MLAARAAGRSVQEVAADFGVSTRTVMRAATAEAVAELRQVTNAFTPPLPDDALKSEELTENRHVSVSNGVWHLPAHWLIDAWTANVGTPTPAQSWQLVSWAEEVGDGDELPDVVRVIVYAGGKGNPWAYAVKAIPQYLGRPEWWQDLTRRATLQATSIRRGRRQPTCLPEPAASGALARNARQLQRRPTAAAMWPAGFRTAASPGWIRRSRRHDACI